MPIMLRTIVLILSLAGLALGAEPEVSFSMPAQLGQLKLEPGLYKLKLLGAVAMFTNTATHKSYSAVTKPEKTSQKSSFTAVMGSSAEGIQRVEAIVIAGSEYRLNFTK